MKLSEFTNIYISVTALSKVYLLETQFLYSNFARDVMYVTLYLQLHTYCISIAICTQSWRLVVIETFVHLFVFRAINHRQLVYCLFRMLWYLLYDQRDICI